MLILPIIILLIFSIGGLYITQLIMVACANKKVLWRNPQESRAKAIMKNGKFHHMKLAYTGMQFVGHLPPGSPDNVDNLLVYEIVPQPNHKAIVGWQEHLIDLLLPARGLIWVGWPEFYDLYKYRFQWMDEKFVDREPETLDSILVTPYIYGMIYKDLELVGGIPYDIRFKVPLQVINPALALLDRKSVV